MTALPMTNQVRLVIEDVMIAHKTRRKYSDVAKERLWRERGTPQEAADYARYAQRLQKLKEDAR